MGWSRCSSFRGVTAVHGGLKCGWWKFTSVYGSAWSVSVTHLNISFLLLESIRFSRFEIKENIWREEASNSKMAKEDFREQQMEGMWCPISRDHLSICFFFFNEQIIINYGLLGSTCYNDQLMEARRWFCFRKLVWWADVGMLINC